MVWIRVEMQTSLKDKEKDVKYN